LTFPSGLVIISEPGFARTASDAPLYEGDASMRYCRPVYAALFCVPAFFTTAVRGDVVYSTPGGFISEGFTAMSSTGGTVASTLPGWMSTIPSYSPSNGSSPSGGLYNFGGTPASNRSLGSIADLVSGTIQYGVRISNATGVTLGSFTVEYFGKQWRDGSTTSLQSLTVDYVVGESPTLSSGGYVQVPGLTFTSPTASGGQTSLNGNAPPNLVQVTSTVTGFNWLAGQELVLRWTDVDNVGDDHGLAIDAFSFTAQAAAVPEASPLLFGGLVICMAGVTAALRWRRALPAGHA